jgi:hypothetical protein
MRLSDDMQLALRDKEGVTTTAEAYDKQMLIALLFMMVLLFLYYQLTSW